MTEEKFDAVLDGMLIKAVDDRDIENWTGEVDNGKCGRFCTWLGFALLGISDWFSDMAEKVWGAKP